MKIGYPCINNSVKCTSSSGFRLNSFTHEKFLGTTESNLDCLYQILQYNAEHGLLFFRVTSDLIPFASHPVNTINWRKIFKDKFNKISNFVKKNNIRLSMHPGHFVVLNSPKDNVIENSVSELKYHTEILEALKMDSSVKIQIHVGGLYNDKDKARLRFLKNYKKLPDFLKQHLVIENDERLFSVADCLKINRQVGVPIVFDAFHHSIFNSGESLKEVMGKVFKTWDKKDGLPMVDYSHQYPDGRVGRHADSVDIKKLKKFLKDAPDFDYDLMLEVKDKEKSAVRALNLLREIV